MQHCDELLTFLLLLQAVSPLAKVLLCPESPATGLMQSRHWMSLCPLQLFLHGIVSFDNSEALLHDEEDREI